MKKNSTETKPSRHAETSPLPEDGSPGPKMPAPATSAESSSSSGVPWRLRIQVSGDSHTTIGMEVKDKIVIGRYDPVSGEAPDIDLSPYGAASRGVSRQHSQIALHGDALYLGDLGSLNGTRLNGFVLETGQSYRLRDGDEIEIGQMRLVLRFVKSIRKLS